MFYVLFILLFIIFFMLYQHHKERHTIPFTLVLVAYFFAILSMMIYYSRDAYYYNVIKNYFYLPDPLWRYLFFLPISRFNVIRLINAASLSIVLASVYFAFAAIQGPSGVMRRIQLQDETQDLIAERDALQAEVDAMKNLTHRLSDEYLDIDLLDERAREVLGLMRPDEVIIR